MGTIEGMGAELWVMQDGVYMNVESPETGQCVTINLTTLVSNMPDAGTVFQEWSAYHVECFNRGRQAPANDEGRPLGLT